jgi:hypothetical protein
MNSMAGDAYQFNGTNNYIATNWAGIMGTGARAISFWAALNVSSSNHMEAVGWGDNTTGSLSQGKRFSTCFNKNSGTFYSSSSLAYCIQGYVPSPAINNLVWHHYVYQIPANATINQIQIYEDAVLLTNPTTFQDINGTTAVNTGPGNNVIFGMLTQGTSQLSFFKGKMDEIGIWNRTLTMCEIIDLYSRQIGCIIVPPVVDPPLTSCCLGNLCADSQNALAGDYEIPLNNFNFNFSGDAADKVNVGYGCGTSGLGKLNALTSVQTNQTPGQESISVYGNNTFNSSGRTGIGVMGEAKNTAHSGESIGVWGNATGSYDNIGGKFHAGSVKKSRYNIGVSAVAFPSTGNSAPYTYQSFYPGPVGANIGVYGSGELTNSPPDAESGGAPGGDWAAWFDGDVNVVGNCFWNLAYQFSDKRLKKDIKPLENVNEKIQKLSGYSYNFRTDEFKERLFDNRTHIGLIAQEVNEVFPELITKDAKGFYAVEYQGMIPVLLEAIKENNKTLNVQQKQIEDLQKRLVAFENKTGNATNINQLNPAAEGFALEQNIPNPFSQETVINYTLPQQVKNASLIVYDLSGKQLTSFPLELNTQSITITAEKLSAGIYIYNLIADGKIMDSKRMVVTNKQ